jgi:hypothetical protein
MAANLPDPAPLTLLLTTKHTPFGSKRGVPKTAEPVVPLSHCQTTRNHFGAELAFASTTLGSDSSAISLLLAKQPLFLVVTSGIATQMARTQIPVGFGVRGIWEPRQSRYREIRVSGALFEPINGELCARAY